MKPKECKIYMKNCKINVNMFKNWNIRKPTVLKTIPRAKIAA